MTVQLCSERYQHTDVHHQLNASVQWEQPPREQINGGETPSPSAVVPRQRVERLTLLLEFTQHQDGLCE